MRASAIVVVRSLPNGDSTSAGAVFSGTVLSALWSSVVVPHPRKCECDWTIPRSAKWVRP